MSDDREHDSVVAPFGMETDLLTGLPTGAREIRCKCGWRVRSRNNIIGLTNAALDHELGRREDRAPLGFSPVVDLDAPSEVDG